MPGYLAAVLADTPTHYWRCADPGGIMVHDIGSAPAVLVFNGNYPLTMPYVGPNDDGGSMAMQAGTYPWQLDQVALAPPFSVECIVWQAIQTNPVVQYLVNCLQTSGVGGIHLRLDTGVPKLQGSAAPLAAAGVAISSQHWHHLVGTIDAAGNGILYVDGVNTAAAAVGAAATTAFTLSLAGLTPTFGQPLVGAIAECAVYPAVLSAARVTAHFNAIDSLTRRPAFRAFGTWDAATGATIVTSATADDIRRAVIHPYLNQP